MLYVCACVRACVRACLAVLKISAKVNTNFLELIPWQLCKR